MAYHIIFIVKRQTNRHMKIIYCRLNILEKVLKRVQFQRRNVDKIATFCKKKKIFFLFGQGYAAL